MDDDGQATRTITGGGVTLRLFAALHVPAEQAEELLAASAELADAGPTARLSRPETLHVTFAFLGDVAEEYVPAIAQALDAAGSSIPGPARCTITGLEPFGGGRVLAADVDIDLLAVLDAARDRFVEAVAPYAPHVDRRPWRPHLSIVRAGAGVDLEHLAGTDLASQVTGSWVSSELHLYASLPAPAGRLHRRLSTTVLGLPIPIA